MKLRMQSNSIRLRLKRGEVDQLMETGRVEERIRFGPGNAGFFNYILEASQAVSNPKAILKAGGILVQVPTQMVSHWGSSDDVGIEVIQAAGDESSLEILIEKDFACLNGDPEQNIDTFPNPLVGTKC